MQRKHFIYIFFFIAVFFFASLVDAPRVFGSTLVDKYMGIPAGSANGSNTIRFDALGTSSNYYTGFVYSTTTTYTNVDNVKTILYIGSGSPTSNIRMDIYEISGSTLGTLIATSNDVSTPVLLGSDTDQNGDFCSLSGTAQMPLSDDSTCINMSYDFPDFTLDNTKTYAFLQYPSSALSDSSNILRSPFRTSVSGPAQQINCTGLSVCTITSDRLTVFQIYQGVDGFSYEDSRIISVEPEDNEIVSSPVTFSSQWFITQSDIDNQSDGIFGLGSGRFSVFAHICALDRFPNCRPGSAQVYYWRLPTGYETSTSTVLTVPFLGLEDLPNNMDYKMTTQLTGDNYWGLFGTFLHLSTTTYFTVGSTTHSGNIRNDVEEADDDYFATSTDVYAVVNASCNPFSSGFDVGLCIYSIVAPPSGILDERLNEIKSQVLTIAPWGYLTRFFVIISGNATTTLPVIDFVFATSSPLFGYDIHLDPFGTLEEADNIINATSTSANPQTIWEIMSQVVNIIVYLMLAFMIIKDLTNSHRHVDNNQKDI